MQMRDQISFNLTVYFIHHGVWGIAFLKILHKVLFILITEV